MKELNEQQDFIVTARKWRPLRFDSVVGQEHITGTLQNALKTGRIHHAYLFCGPRGVGKTTTARILARAVNCLEPVNNEPCNVCSNCTAVLAGRSIDVIEIDGASNNSVDDIRKLRENAKYAPSLGKYKMYIIDEVHMLSTSAFNALLKTLEEPPPHLLFVFATTESHKVPATIISRCQRFDFRRMEIDHIVNQLRFISEKENITIDEESLVTIAKKGDGSMRDSQSIFDQVIAFCGTDVKYTEMASALHLIDEEFFFKITDAIADRNTNDVFSLAQEVISRGYELQETLQGLLEHFRNILTIIVTKDTKLIKTSTAFLAKYRETANKFTKANILRYLQIINSTEQAIKFMPQPRIRFELALVGMAEMDRAMEVKELIEEIRSLKSGVSLPAVGIGANTEKKKSEPDLDQANRTAETGNTALKSAPQAKPAQTKENTAETLKSKWRSFTTALIKHDASFNTINQAVPSFHLNEIILKSDNSFVVDNVSNKLDLIEKFSTEYFGRLVKFSIVTVDTSESSIPPPNRPNSFENKENKTNTSNQQIKASAGDDIIVQDDEQKFKDKHPVEVKIMKLFNAVELRG